MLGGTDIRLPLFTASVQQTKSIQSGDQVLSHKQISSKHWHVSRLLALPHSLPTKRLVCLSLACSPPHPPSSSSPLLLVPRSASWHPWVHVSLRSDAGRASTPSVAGVARGLVVGRAAALR